MIKRARFTGARRAGLGRLTSRICLIVAGIFAGLLVAEIALRVFGFQHFNPYIEDADVGYALRPGAEGWWEREARTYIKINSQGFRDREHSIAKPADTLRIAVLGDSYAEAFQVPLEKTFWSLMEPQITRCGPGLKTNIQVLNFGVSGFSTARQLILLEKRVWQYSPDVVVLLFTVGNDVRDNSAQLNKYKKLPLPYFVLQNGKLILDNSRVDERNNSFTFHLRQSFFGKLFHWTQQNVRLLGVVYAAREGLNAATDSVRNESKRGPTEAGFEPGLDSEVYRAPTSEQWDEAWRITESMILRMRNDVVQKGAKFLVVTGSMGVQVNPDPKVREAFMNSLKVPNLYYPEQRIKSLGENEGIRVLNLAPVFEEYATRNRVFLHGAGELIGRGHWNENGHRLAGELMAKEICSFYPSS